MDGMHVCDGFVTAAAEPHRASVAGEGGGGLTSVSSCSCQPGGDPWRAPGRTFQTAARLRLIGMCGGSTKACVETGLSVPQPEGGRAGVVVISDEGGWAGAGGCEFDVAVGRSIVGYRSAALAREARARGPRACPARAVIACVSSTCVWRLGLELARRSVDGRRRWPKVECTRGVGVDV